MKKIIISIALLLNLLNLSFSQVSNNIANIKWEVNEDRQAITITYDLMPIDYFRSFEISITAILDGQRVNTQHMKGDVGPFVEAGRGKKVEWNFFADVPNGLQGNLEFEITPSNIPIADSDQDGIPDNADKCPFKPGKIDKGGCPAVIPWWAGLTPVAATGITLTTAGLTKQSHAKQALTNEYPLLANPLSNDYDPTAASNLYNQLKKDHNKGTVIAIGGAIVLGTAGFIAIKRLINDQKKAKDRRLRVYPNVGLDWNRQGDLNRTTAGAGLKYRF